MLQIITIITLIAITLFILIYPMYLWKHPPETKRQLIFSPQPNPTVDELMSIIGVLIFSQQYPGIDMMSKYNSLPENVKRHFKIHRSRLD